jgi:glutamate receptor, ionotropic, invertebrate
MAFSLLYAAYTANIVSLLQSPSKNIQTVEDLYKSKIELWVEETPYFRYYFPKAEKSIYRKIYLEKLAPPGKKDHYVKAEKGVGLIQKGLNGNTMI